MNVRSHHALLTLDQALPGVRLDRIEVRMDVLEVVPGQQRSALTVHREPVADVLLDLAPGLRLCGGLVEDLAGDGVVAQFEAHAARVVVHAGEAPGTEGVKMRTVGRSDGWTLGRPKVVLRRGVAQGAA